MLSLTTGMRVGEPLGLGREVVNLDAGTLLMCRQLQHRQENARCLVTMCDGWVCHRTHRAAINTVWKWMDRLIGRQDEKSRGTVDEDPPAFPVRHTR
jgi:integrase